MEGWLISLDAVLGVLKSSLSKTVGYLKKAIEDEMKHPFDDLGAKSHRRMKVVANGPRVVLLNDYIFAIFTRSELGSQASPSVLQCI